jgi:hypothetical protein
MCSRLVSPPTSDCEMHFSSSCSGWVQEMGFLLCTVLPPPVVQPSGSPRVDCDELKSAENRRKCIYTRTISSNSPARSCTSQFITPSQ